MILTSNRTFQLSKLRDSPMEFSPTFLVFTRKKTSGSTLPRLEWRQVNCPVLGWRSLDFFKGEWFGGDSQGPQAKVLGAGKCWENATKMTSSKFQSWLRSTNFRGQNSWTELLNVRLRFGMETTNLKRGVASSGYMCLYITVYITMSRSDPPFWSLFLFLFLTLRIHANRGVAWNKSASSRQNLAAGHWLFWVLNMGHCFPLPL